MTIPFAENERFPNENDVLLGNRVNPGRPFFSGQAEKSLFVMVLHDFGRPFYFGNFYLRWS